MHNVQFLISSLIKSSLAQLSSVVCYRKSSDDFYKKPSHDTYITRRLSSPGEFPGRFHSVDSIAYFQISEAPPSFSLFI